MPQLKILGDSPTTEDGLGFGAYVDILLDAIYNFDATSSLTIGIHGSWGSGKTSLMRMLEKRFEDDNDVKTIWFNAWAHGGEESIGLALLHRVLTKLQKEEGNKEKVGNVLANVVKLLVDAGLRRTTGITLEEAQEVFKSSIEIKSTLRDDFETAIAECLQNKRLVVFIDDLDRCLPEKTIEILEVIKLFLDVPRCVFVIGVARDVIEQGFEGRYKTNGRLKNSGREYIEKIIQVPFTLPPIREMEMRKFIESLSMNEKERELAELVAKVTYCNPRKVKMFLNISRIQQGIAEKTGGRIEPEISIKVSALGYMFPEFFNDLVKYKEEKVICTLERLVTGNYDEALDPPLEDSEMLQKYYQDEDLKSLLKIEPFLCEIDLEPYIYLSGKQPDKVLVSDQSILDDLLSGDSVKIGHATNAIKTMPDDDQQRYLEMTMSKFKNGTATERRKAAIALGRIGDVKAVEPLITALKSKDEDQTVRLLATRALGKITDVRAIDPLIEALSDENEEIRMMAAEALGKLGDAQAVEPLVEALQDEDKYVREYAVGALGEIGDIKAVEPLIDALTDVIPEVRGVVAHALGVIGDPRAVKPLREVLEWEGEGVNEIVLESIKKIEAKQTTLADNKQNDSKKFN